MRRSWPRRPAGPLAGRPLRADITFRTKILRRRLRRRSLKASFNQALTFRYEVRPEIRRGPRNPKTGFSPPCACSPGFFVCLIAGACAPGAACRTFRHLLPGVYRLGPGDVVRVITFGEDSTTGEFRVDDSGAIALPLAGTDPGIRAFGRGAGLPGGRQTLQQKNMLRAPSVVGRGDRLPADFRAGGGE